MHDVLNEINEIILNMLNNQIIEFHHFLLIDKFDKISDLISLGVLRLYLMQNLDR